MHKRRAWRRQHGQRRWFHAIAATSRAIRSRSKRKPGKPATHPRRARIHADRWARIWAIANVGRAVSPSRFRGNAHARIRANSIVRRGRDRTPTSVSSPERSRQLARPPRSLPWLSDRQASARRTTPRPPIRSPLSLIQLLRLLQGPSLLVDRSCDLVNPVSDAGLADLNAEPSPAGTCIA